MISVAAGNDGVDDDVHGVETVGKFSKGGRRLMLKIQPASAAFPVANQRTQQHTLPTGAGRVVLGR